ncbi:MAG: PAS-domain containing protein [Planktomarina sp.]
MIDFGMTWIVVGLAFTVCAGQIYVSAWGAKRTAASVEELPEPKLALGGLIDEHPDPIWRVNNFGLVVWANKAAQSVSRSIFTVAQSHKADTITTKRVSIMSDAQTQQWFDVAAHPSDSGATYYATPADAEVAAHASRREFVQTLAKTFAQLSTGLAIFDKQRTLVSFNPALLDLTGISFGTLSSQPHLFSFMDYLRDLGIIPEPKDYATWRKQLGDVIHAAENDHFVDVWTLPSGQTIQVTGKPHPDGAIAFLFEDITQETVMVQRFREQVSQLTSAFDQLDIGTAVFAHDGALIYANSEYHKLWGLSPQLTKTEMTLHDCARVWRIKSEKSDLWKQIHVSSIEDSPACEGQVRTSTGQSIQVKFSRLPNNSTMATFAAIRSTPTAIMRARA